MDKERNSGSPWMSVPQFGDWDQKGGVPDYSMDFSKIREMRKQNKREVSRASLGNEEEFISKQSNNNNNNNNNQVHQIPQHHDIVHDDHHHLKHSPTGRRSFLSYFNCCVKA